MKAILCSVFSWMGGGGRWVCTLLEQQYQQYQQYSLEPQPEVNTFLRLSFSTGNTFWGHPFFFNQTFSKNPLWLLSQKLASWNFFFFKFWI